MSSADYKPRFGRDIRIKPGVKPRLERTLRAEARKLGVALTFFQSNHEGALIDKIGELADRKFDGIIINPGAFSHTSVALLDALNAFEGAVIEVHISNIHKREAFRHHSYVSMRAEGVIAGCGTQGYSLALRRVARLGLA